jgi:hypothetical protein
VPGQPQPAEAGVTFAATDQNSAYVARNDHQHWANPVRNRWATTCPPPSQYEIFCDAEDNDWRDSRPALWGLRPDLPILGTNKQRLAKFPEPPNDDDAWHGYPVSCWDENSFNAHVPEESLLDRWFEAGLITDTQRSRIRRRKV